LNHQSQNFVTTVLFAEACCANERTLHKRKQKEGKFCLLFLGYGVMSLICNHWTKWRSWKTGEFAVTL